MTTINGWVIPDDLDVPDGAWYRIDYGGNEVWGMSWHAHVALTHQRGISGIDVEVVDSGTDRDGIKYAAVRAAVEIDGDVYSALQAADETTTQVRDPEFVYAVAESRALKRAVKKALNIYPADESTTQAADESAGGDSGGSVDVGPDGDVEVSPPPEYGGDGEAGEDDW